MDFSIWCPGAIACLQYAYHPQLLLTFLLDGKTPPDSYAYVPRPAASETFVNIFKRAYPGELTRLQNEISLQLWHSMDHPKVWGWHEDAEALIHETLREARTPPSGITVEHVTCALLSRTPVVQLLTSLGVNPGGLAQGLRVAIHHGSRKMGSEYLASHHSRPPSGMYCVCPWIIEDQLIGGRDDGVLEVLSMPFLRSKHEIPIDSAGPVTCISAPVLHRDDTVTAVASRNLVRRVIVGEGSLGPVVGLGALVTALGVVGVTTAAVSTADGRLSMVDLVHGTVLRSRKLAGGPATSVTAARFSKLDPSEILVVTTNDRTVRAWTASKLRAASEWQLPDTVPYQRNVWDPVHIRRATACDVAGSVIVAGVNEEMFAVFGAESARKSARSAETLVNDPEYNGFRNASCVGVRIDGDEMLLCTSHVSRIMKVPEAPQGVVPLRSGLFCEERRQLVATSPGLKETVLLDPPYGLTVLLRSRLITVTPDLEQGLKAVQNWR